MAPIGGDRSTEELGRLLAELAERRTPFGKDRVQQLVSALNAASATKHCEKGLLCAVGNLARDALHHRDADPAARPSPEDFPVRGWERLFKASTRFFYCVTCTAVLAALSRRVGREWADEALGDVYARWSANLSRNAKPLDLLWKAVGHVAKDFWKVDGKWIRGRIFVEDYDALASEHADNPEEAVQREWVGAEARAEVLRAIDALDPAVRRAGWHLYGGAALDVISTRQVGRESGRGLKPTTSLVERFEGALEAARQRLGLTREDFLALRVLAKEHLDVEFGGSPLPTDD